MARTILEKATDDARAEDSPAADARRREIADETSRTLDARRKNDPSPKGEIDAFTAHAEEPTPDDLPNLAAQREAAREHGDTYVVAADLEDTDQREAWPGTREQN
ncbi:hypothetical protein GCM10010520_22200 [Rhizobium viscosum]|uniref:Uncharacterized protein n=1 Tax=Rhizobium viscosum TaxID=1673 RepID=A0ABR9IIJ0_RHIVS|nr:hypothetical protein [Rhizobium viscosum]MBE1502989.1 hypothetical protein [Rhizobium viscosum]